MKPPLGGTSLITEQQHTRTNPFFQVFRFHEIIFT